MARIFFVEDNANLREAAVSYLELDGHQVVEFERVKGVLEAVSMAPPELIVLDVMLPDGNGFMLARRIREASNVPILFLTARTAESDRITGFEVGGDDYVLKPFSPKELVLRIGAILRRGAGTSEESQTRAWTLDDHQLVLDDRAHRATADGRELSLTAAEWKILEYLAENSGTVMSRQQLLGACLDYIAEGSERTIDTHVKNLRSKLGEVRWIETVRGFGYRFSGSEETGAE
jgi:two-component system phosphate regulon response regulator PhoB